MISAGTLSTLLTAGHVAFRDEAREVLRAGLASTPYQHLDDTSTRVDGDGQYCHVLCNPFYTVYQTRPTKDRRTIVEILRGGRPVDQAGRRDHQARTCQDAVAAGRLDRLIDRDIAPEIIGANDQPPFRGRCSKRRHCERSEAISCR